MILKIIERNNLNLQNDMIKLYINNIFDFFVNKDLDSLSNDYTFYLGIKNNLKFHFQIEEEKSNLEQINDRFSSDYISNYKRFLLVFVERLKILWDILF